MRLKSELYEKEQIQIMNKVIQILDLDENNSTTLYELDHNTDKQTCILKLIPEIRKYFTFTHMTGVINPDKIKRPYLSVIRHITKLKYNMTSFDHRIIVNNELIRTKKYIFSEKKDT